MKYNDKYKTILERILDPFVHIIRNAVDHGIELPDVRIANGKPPYGTIEVSARHKSGRIIIEVRDDGKGINREAVLNKAIHQGLIQADSNISDTDIDNLIFRAGFSTAEKVSEVSGRGVGMDVVKRNVANMGGRISISSTPGKGCRMTLSLPLTLAVMDGMTVSVGSQRFVLPTVNIIESFKPQEGSMSRLANGISVIRARGEFVRILPLFNIFNIRDSITCAQEALVILLESDEGDRIAVMVDDVLGQQQVVIKSLETNFKSVQGISAATILGNGDVALILDVPGLVEMSGNIDLTQQIPQAHNDAGSGENTQNGKVAHV
jgi:two-component system chemotaxis sensor kinase CheA